MSRSLRAMIKPNDTSLSIVVGLYSMAIVLMSALIIIAGLLDNAGMLTAETQDMKVRQTVNGDDTPSPVIRVQAMNNKAKRDSDEDEISNGYELVFEVIKEHPPRNDASTGENVRSGNANMHLNQITCNVDIQRDLLNGIANLHRNQRVQEHPSHNKTIKCDVLIRKDWYGNTVSVGGSTMYEALPERVQRQIKQLAPDLITSIAPQERKLNGIADLHHNQIQKSQCYVTLDFDEEMQQEVLLFDPKGIGQENEGIHKLLYRSVAKCDVNIMKEYVLQAKRHWIFPIWSIESYIKAGIKTRIYGSTSIYNWITSGVIWKAKYIVT